MGYGDADRGNIEGLCRAACGANPSFAVVAGGIETCEDLVAYGRQAVAADYADRCPEGAVHVTPHEECAVFGRRFAECLADACPPAGGALLDTFAGATADFCDRSVAAGQTNPEQIAQLVNENTPCDSQFLQMIVAQNTTDTPGRDDDGTFAQFCAQGPLTPAATCRAACAVVASCITDENADNGYLRNADRCVELCVGVASPPAAAWACTANLQPGQCSALGQCFAPPPVEACGAYGERAAACVAATCAPIAPFGAGLAGQLRTFCDGEVAAGRAHPEMLADIGPETPCEDPRLAPAVAALTAPPAPDGTGGGALAAVCRDGTVEPEDRCDAACRHFGPCIPENDNAAALRDLDTCRYFCATTHDVPDALWQCLEGADNGCPSIAPCFMMMGN
jgi:hypothetical protein